MHYYGTRLSENISRREPEGYLLCLNVPVARTGTQDYLPEELGLPPGSSFISVYRPEEEVFSPETVASFEGMPVTNDHPPEGVDVSNIRALQKGHAHNVRRGTGEESDLLLADLIITDPGLISLILEEGKREISCGYTYELCEENGQYIQRKIRGNHVAVVDAGRAGKRVAIRDHKGCDLSASTQAPLEPAPRVSIKDHKAKEPERMSRRPNLRFGKRLPCYSRPPLTSASEVRAECGDRRTNNLRGETAMKKSLSKILARMAKDGDIETVAEIIEEMIEPEAPAEEETTEVVVVETPKGEEPATASGGNLAGSEVIRNEQAPQCGAATIENAETTVVVDEVTLGEVISRLDQIITLLTPAASDEDPAEGEPLRAAGGGNSVRGEVSRNEQAPQCGAATIEAAVAEAVEEAIEAVAAEEAVAEVIQPEATSTEEISEMLEEIVDPVSEVIEAEEDECEEPEPEVLSTGDALRAALRAVGPALAKMPKKQRQRVCADIAARLNGLGGRSGADTGIYAALAAARRKTTESPADLGKRIMATRSANRARQ